MDHQKGASAEIPGGMGPAGSDGETRRSGRDLQRVCEETSKDAGKRPRGGTGILNRPMVLLLTASLGALGGFYLLAPVVPLYAATSGAGGVGAGLSTGAMMLGTVLTEFAVPTLLRAHGYRTVMGLGLFLLGAPALLLPASASMPSLLGICLARGAGLGLVVVAGAALIAELVPADRRGEGLGLYGVAVGVPSIACLPLGLWLSEHVGYGPVFAAGAALSLLALAAVPGLPSRRARPQRHEEGHEGNGRTRRGPAVLRDGGIARPALVFALVTPAAGVLLTFLPLAAPGRSRDLVAVALLVQSCATPFARWAAGRYGDRHGSARLLAPAVLAAALGTAGLFWVDNPVAMIVGMGLFGAGYGMAQNATLALMFERAPESAFGQVSATWNLAYDAGLGVGAVGFGLLAGPVGYPAGFAVTAGVLLTALAPALYDRARHIPVKKHETRRHDPRQESDDLPPATGDTRPSARVSTPEP
ncbi:MFS transporter [Streptosporangium sp. NPDC000509]|uniref:MFS transporter n=1 Tax=Streptosporangium sp. NPDC000509 TaxID=3366186 RepID=UPI00367E135B